MQSFRSRNIGLFGGTFNPVHNGHLAIARYVLECNHVDEVLFVPAPHPPHKQSPSVSFSHRVAMLELALGSMERVSVSLIETSYNGPSFTIRTVEKLEAQTADHQYFLIIGADSLVDLPAWYRAGDLLEKVSLIVAGRGQVDENAVNRTLETLNMPYSRHPEGMRWELENGNSITYLPAIRWPVSSSSIRAELARGLRPSMLPEQVYRYIRKHNLYRDD